MPVSVRAQVFASRPDQAVSQRDLDDVDQPAGDVGFAIVILTCTTLVSQDWS